MENRNFKLPLLLLIIGFISNPIIAQSAAEPTPQNYQTGFFILLTLVISACVITIAWLLNINRKNQVAIKASTAEKERLDAILQKMELNVKETPAAKKQKDQPAFMLSDESTPLKDAFLTNISHEIRTPLNGITGFTTLIQQEAEKLEHAKILKNCDFVHTCSDRLLAYLDNIIEISRIEADEVELDPEPCNLNVIIPPLVDKYSFLVKEKKINLVVDYQDLPPVKGDKKYLQKIIHNILDNAVKFTNYGQVDIKFEKTEKVLSIIIQDSGIGIDEKYQEYVLEIFSQESEGYSRKYEGGGLGLPIAQKLTHMMGGNLYIISEKGKGTSIKISLPVYTEFKECIYKPIVQTAIKTIDEDQHTSILVIEDDKMNRELMQAYLRERSDVAIAEDGEMALSFIEEAHSQGKIFNLLLIDINLPAPWNGLSLMKEIQKRWPEYLRIPMVAQTAHALKGDKEKLIHQGFNDYISKPIKRKELYQKIDLLSQSQDKSVNSTNQVEH